MTDREILLANNQKIAEIQETLKNKILALGDSGITIELPEEFSPFSTVSYFQINNKLLVTANISGSPSTSCGLWLYNLTTNKWKQLYDTYYGWEYFQQVSDTTVLIGSIAPNVRGLLKYDDSTETCEKIYDTGRWNSFYILKDKCLIGSNLSDTKNLLVYNIATETIEIMQGSEDISDLYNFILANENQCIITKYYQINFVLVYNYTTNIATKIDLPFKINSTQFIYKINDQELFLWPTQTAADGLYKLNINLNTVELVYEVTGFYSTQAIHTFDNKILFAKIGLLYNISDGSFSKIYDNITTTLSNIGSVDNYCFLCYTGSNTGSSYNGLWVFNNLDNSITKFSITKNNFEIFHVFGNKVLISANSYLCVFYLDTGTYKQVIKNHQLSSGMVLTKVIKQDEIYVKVENFTYKYDKELDVINLVSCKVEV